MSASQLPEDSEQKAEWDVLRVSDVLRLDQPIAFGRDLSNRPERIVNLGGYPHK
jgi:hypothetical protein